ncbi:MAG: hypothetical protein ABL929_08770 [Ferruginibacter sp.]|nr:hypothetical protein [Ferruginibacter sp.]
MRQDTLGTVITLTKEQMKELTSQTKETIALDAFSKEKNIRTYSSVDLWNTRKNHRSMLSMRKWIN